MNWLIQVFNIVGSICGLVLFYQGLLRYKKDQDWKRNEFVAKEMKEFLSNRMIQNTMYIIDWGVKSIQLFPDKSNYDERFQKIDREILISALEYHENRPVVLGQDRYTVTEIAIRDNFDQFLSYLEMFDHFIETGLISTRELEPYLRYWITAISEDMDNDARQALYIYIEKYKYSGVQSLFKKFGKNIIPPLVQPLTKSLA